MPKSLAEMRSSQSVGLPERTYPICLAGKLVAQIEELEAKYDAVEDKPSNGRLASKSEAKKIADEIDALRDEMNDHLIAVHLRAKPGHEWRAFVAEHPPTDLFIDQRSGIGIDAAIRDLPEFIVSVNGEDLKPGDWDFVIANAADGDLKGCVGMLMDMHNAGVDIPKSRRSSRTTEEPLSD